MPTMRTKARPTPPPMTGQLLVHTVRGPLLVHEKSAQEGRTLWIVVGVIAVPPEHAWDDGYQYTVYSTRKDRLMIALEGAIDRSQEAFLTTDQMLAAPIWRV